MYLSNELIDKIILFYPKYYKISKKYYKIFRENKKYHVKIIINFLKKIKKEKLKYRFLTLGSVNKLNKKELIKHVIYHYNYDTFVGYPEIIIGSFNLETKLLDSLPEFRKRKIYDLYRFLKKEEITKNMLYDARY